MNRVFKQMVLFAGCLLLYGMYGIAQSVSTTWDDPSTTFDGWSRYGMSAFWEYKENGGNPGGFVRVYGNNVTGIINTGSAFTGNYAEKNYNTISVDVMVIMQQLPVYKPEIIIRHTASYAAWRYKLNNFTTQAGIWQHFDVHFDPDWSDEEAIANGWSTDEGPVFSFSNTCRDVRSAGIRGNYPSNTSKEIGYDNFTLSYREITTPEEPEETNEEISPPLQPVANWDDPALNYAGWSKIGVSANMNYKAEGGNPGGYLEVVGSGVTGIVNTTPVFTGNFEEKDLNAIAVDIKVMLQQLPAYKPAVFLRHTSSYAAWRYAINEFTIANAGTWQHFEISFDPEWTDEEAIAKGWVRDQGTAISFRETCLDVRSVGISSSYPEVAAKSLGFDNFSLFYKEIVTPKVEGEPKPVYPVKQLSSPQMQIQMKQDTIKTTKPAKLVKPRP